MNGIWVLGAVPCLTAYGIASSDTATITEVDKYPVLSDALANRQGLRDPGHGGHGEEVPMYKLAFLLLLRPLAAYQYNVRSVAGEDADDSCASNFVSIQLQIAQHSQHVDRTACPFHTPHTCWSRGGDIGKIKDPHGHSHVKTTVTFMT